MAQTVILTGDINLLGVNDPKIPFAQIGPMLKKADLVISNFEFIAVLLELRNMV